MCKEAGMLGQGCRTRAGGVGGGGGKGGCEDGALLNNRRLQFFVYSALEWGCAFVMF